MYKIINILMFLLVIFFIFKVFSFYSSNKNISYKNYNRSNIDLILKEKIKSDRLSFGSPKRLYEYLGVFPGAVSPICMLSLIHI